jgi:hypothetical protein
MLTVAQSDYEEKVFLARDLRIKIYARQLVAKMVFIGLYFPFMIWGQI